MAKPLYKITVKVSNFAKALEHVKMVKDYMDDEAGKVVTKAAFNAAGDVFDQNFQREGSGFGIGGWASLADDTVRKRIQKGFGGEHPILIRYGKLRQITAGSLRDANSSGVFSAGDPDGKDIRVQLRIDNSGGYATATGDKAWNQIPTRYAPARPFWFTTRTVQNKVRRLAVERLAEGLRDL